MIGNSIGHRFALVPGLLALLLFLSSPAFADCTSPARTAGTIIYNSAQNVPQVCAGSNWVALGALNPGAGGGSCTNPARTEGAIVYNEDFNVLQYCDGTNWMAVQAAPAGGGGGGCTAPSSCPNVGDVCSDGSIFAGFVFYGGSCAEVLYVTDDNQSTSIQWKNASGTNDIDPDDAVDGRANHTNRGGNLADFAAFDLCESNTYHGKSDWYLPASDELDLLYENQAAIDANAAGAFTANGFWSSTEASASNASTQHFGTGAQSSVGKTNTRRVRCVRRD